MRDYSKISPKFWIGETGKRIRREGPECITVAFYLLTNQHANMLGLYYLPMAYLAYDTGLGEEGASKALARLSEAGFCQYDEASEHVWVVEMARFQIGEQLSPNDNQVKGVKRELSNLPKTSLVQGFVQKYGAAFHLDPEQEKASPSEAPSKPLRSQEQEQEIEQEQDRGTRKRAMQLPEDFAPDDELLAWAREKTPGADPAAETEQFIDHHRAKGTTAKDWRAAWRTWMRNAVRFSKGNNNKPAAPAPRRKELGRD